MATWGLFVEETEGSGDNRRWEAEMLGHFEGTHEEAMEELRRHAVHYKPRHPLSVRRSWLYRDGDGYLMINRGMTSTYHCRFTAAELVWDSKDPSAAAQATPLSAGGPYDEVPPGYASS
ncbi:hypothetical protein [Actinacidiphila oryziradicis]|uniref:hypothetical protein n=1 Tax=Actinacidiphila oryziradicis TaxID=2571141 RepID=UPI0023F571F6|nr:hypothetical protein [Actinacidiphila oryziradicis]MCW2875417.1 hypothetical protein [Actinacidiphila oryziradicis]